MQDPPRRRGLFERAYAWVVRLYPSAFRDEYEREMGSAFHSQLASAGPRRGRVVAGALTDVLLTAPGVHLDLLRQDLRYAWRTLTAPAQRSFAVAAILTLALGIGAATAIFSIVHAVMLAPLPFHAADRLVRIYETNQERNINEFSVSYPNFDSWQRRVKLLSLAAAKGAEANLTDGGSPEHVVGMAVTSGFLPTLGLAPVAGRDFRADEDRPGGVRVAMVSEGLWQRRYGRDPGLIGRSIALDGVGHTVIGIARQDVGFATTVDVWVPMAADLAAENRDNKQLDVVARLADGATVAGAQAELNTVAAALEAEFPTSNAGWRVRLVPAFDDIVDDELQQRLMLLLVAVGLLLAVACANVANLQMARAASRTGEIGVRLALGASRARLMRQTLTESLLIAGVGGGLGLALAWAMMRGSSGRAAGLHPPARQPVTQSARAPRGDCRHGSGRHCRRPAAGDRRGPRRHSRRRAARGLPAGGRSIEDAGAQRAGRAAAGAVDVSGGGRPAAAAKHMEPATAAAGVLAARSPAYRQHHAAAIREVEHGSRCRLL